MSLAQQTAAAQRVRPQMVLLLRVLLIVGAMSALALFAVETASLMMPGWR